MSLASLRSHFRAYSKQTLPYKKNAAEAQSAQADVECRHMHQLLVRGDNIVMIHRGDSVLV